MLECLPVTFSIEPGPQDGCGHVCTKADILHALVQVDIPSIVVSVWKLCTLHGYYFRIAVQNNERGPLPILSPNQLLNSDESWYFNTLLLCSVTLSSDSVTYKLSS
jgi:hypothetical protein